MRFGSVVSYEQCFRMPMAYCYYSTYFDPMLSPTPFPGYFSCGLKALFALRHLFSRLLACHSPWLRFTSRYLSQGDVGQRASPYD